MVDMDVVRATMEICMDGADFPWAREIKFVVGSRLCLLTVCLTLLPQRIYVSPI